MQAISTIRWPSSGSRPVVSVSSTTSRIPPPATAFPAPPRLRPPSVARGAVAQHSDDLGQPTQALVSPESRRDDEIGAAALFGIRHLPAEDGGESLRRHSRPCQ